MLSNLVLECWTAPLKQSDIRPSPRGGHRMARIDDERAAMFGGKGEHDRNNELWVLNLDQNVSLLLHCNFSLLQRVKIF